MGRFTTDKLVTSCNNINPNYTVANTGHLHVPVNVNGRWRTKPADRRFFTDDQVREIRASTAASRHLAEVYDCSHILIYYIKKRAIYSDVN